MRLNWVRTECDAVVAEGFPEEAVELPHVLDSVQCPAILGGGRLDLFAEGLQEIRFLRDMVEHVGNGLKLVSKLR